MDAPGKMFLQVTGILYIVFSGWAVLSLLLGNFALGALAVIVFRIFMGIGGVKHCDSPEEARKLRGYAIADLVLYGIALLLGIFVLGLPFVFNLLISLPLPILYLIGAKKNMAAYEDMTFRWSQEENSDM
ncbi:MAG: hypothetical protein FWC72_00795 [Oscillospiraceae bacterium]|nr:hypothetical protein [Oscillospiraceae bacterium]